MSEQHPSLDVMPLAFDEEIMLAGPQGIDGWLAYFEFQKLGVPSIQTDAIGKPVGRGGFESLPPAAQVRLYIEPEFCFCVSHRHDLWDLMSLTAEMLISYSAANS
jgi:hypothetical protein